MDTDGDAPEIAGQQPESAAEVCTQIGKTEPFRVFAVHDGEGKPLKKETQMSSSNLVPFGRQALTNRRNEMVRRGIAQQAEMEVFRHDVATDVVCRKIDNVDYATRRRLQGTQQLGKQGVDIIRERPETTLLVNDALLDREAAVSSLVRGLAR